MNPKNVDRRIDPILDTPIPFALADAPAADVAASLERERFEAVTTVGAAAQQQHLALLEDECDCGQRRGEHQADFPHALVLEDGTAHCGAFRLFGGPRSYYYAGAPLAERSGPRLVVDNRNRKPSSPPAGGPSSPPAGGGK
jgi:hypothetical protein